MRREVHLSMRVPSETLAEIDRNAKDRNLSRTAYICAVCTGDILPPPASQTEKRVAGLEERVAVIESHMRLLGFRQGENL